MLISLIRVTSDLNATYGILCINNAPICVTMELPYRDNNRNTSCIPTGVYNVTKYKSEKRGNTFWVHDVPNRSSILIHSGNFPKDTQGCILVGEKFAAPAILADSQNALKLLNERLPHKFTLEIK